MSERSSTSIELASLLDAWGGAPERWPPHVRRRIDEIARAAPDAQELLAEAGALDALLEAAREREAVLPPARRHALTSRIVSAARAAEVPAAEPMRKFAEVVPLQPRPRVQPRPVQRGEWRAAALMAASLLLGIYLGGAINVAPALQDLVDAIGISAEFEPTMVAVGMDAADEEAL